MKHKFFLISIMLLIITIFIGNAGHVALSLLMTLLVFGFEQYTNRLLSKFQEQSDKEVAKAKKDANDITNKTIDFIKQNR